MSSQCCDADPWTQPLIRLGSASGYIGVAKYRCDLGIARTAAAIRLALRAARGRVFAAHEPVGVSGTPDVSYCRGGPHDPWHPATS